MSRSSFGQPPQPQLGMSGPKGLPGPMSAPKAPPQAGIAPPAGMPPGRPVTPLLPPQGVPQPSMFRRPRY